MDLSLNNHGFLLLVVGGLGLAWLMLPTIKGIFGGSAGDEGVDAPADVAPTTEEQAEADLEKEIERLEKEVAALVVRQGVHATQRDRLMRFLRDRGYYYLSRERYVKHLVLLLQRAEEGEMRLSLGKKGKGA